MKIFQGGEYGEGITELFLALEEWAIIYENASPTEVEAQTNDFFCTKKDTVIFLSLDLG